MVLDCLLRAFLTLYNCLYVVTSTYYSVPFPVFYHFSVHQGLGHSSAILFLLNFGLSRS